MSRRRGLGKGLNALLGDAPAVPASSSPAAASPAAAVPPPPSTITELPLSQLEPNRFQPRAQFDESGLEELAESIRAQGVVQPIVVTPNSAEGEASSGETPSGETPSGPTSRYTIIAGERRWRAAGRIGLETVPVVVREITDDQQILEMALVENLQRADLNPMEEAEAYRTLRETFSLSQEEIAARVGKGRTTVTNTLRLLRLPEEVQDLLRSGQLTAGQARPLLAVPERDRQVELAEWAVREGLTARDLEALTASPKAKEPKKTEEETDVHTRAAMEKLTQSLQTRVEIVRKRKGGQVRVHFHSEDELIRLFDRLMQGND